jgi:hypothetical protein
MRLCSLPEGLYSANLYLNTALTSKHENPLPLPPSFCDDTDLSPQLQALARLSDILRKRIQRELHEQGRKQVKKIPVEPIGNVTRNTSNLFAYLGIEPCILRLTTSLKGCRLLLFNY